MAALRRFALKILSLVSRGRQERDLDREIAAHLALMADDFELRGMTRADAQLAARRAYGGVDQAKELHRDERSFPWVEQTWQDVRHAGRALARTPAFTLVAIATLALGIGVNTTLFTAYNALALKPLPVSKPQEVVRIKRWFDTGARGDIQFAFSTGEFAHIRERCSGFSSVVATSWPLTVVGERETFTGQVVSANYFTDLGVTARIGRTFLPDEDRAPGANPVIVLSFPFWQTRYSGDPRIIGGLIKIAGTSFTIIGVTPESFTGTFVYPQVPNFWAPLSMQAQLQPGNDWQRSPGNYRLQLLARLKPDVTRSGAQAEVDTLVRQLTATPEARDKTEAVTLTRTSFVADSDDPRFRAFVAALMLIVGMVLMVACANLANMLLARGAARQREIGVRLALGASRGRVVAHLLTESVLLALAGGTAGVILSIWTSRLLWIELARLLAIAGPGILLSMNLNPDYRVFAYAILLSLATGVLFGLTPALQSVRPDLITSLKQEGTPLGQRLGRSKLRGLLVSAQVAVSMILLVFAGFLTRGLVRAQSVDTGLQSKNLFLLFAEYDRDPAKAATRERLLLEQLRSLPQVRSAATGGVPMMGTWTPQMIAGDRRGRTLGSYASSHYFESTGIPLVRGRDFLAQETNLAPLQAGAGVHGSSRAAAERAAIVSESAARMFWPGQDPIGKQFQLDMDFRGSLADFEVVGVAKDVRFANLTRVDPSHVYLAGYTAGTTAILLQVEGDHASALKAIRKAIETFDPALLANVNLLALEDGPLRLQRSMASAFGMFAVILAALALTLAGVGIYGVMTYLVTQRAKEVGIRMALGASQAGVLNAVVVRGLRPVFSGIAIGAVIAGALSSALHTTLAFPGSIDLLYGVPFYDPATFLGLAGFLAMVAAAASFAPARRAMRVDPIEALRHE